VFKSLLQSVLIPLLKGKAGDMTDIINYINQSITKSDISDVINIASNIKLVYINIVIIM
jgi:hypothetical protein